MGPTKNRIMSDETQVEMIKAYGRRPECCIGMETPFWRKMLAGMETLVGREMPASLCPSAIFGAKLALLQKWRSGKGWSAFPSRPVFPSRPAFPSKKVFPSQCSFLPQVGFEPGISELCYASLRLNHHGYAGFVEKAAIHCSLSSHQPMRDENGL